MYSLWKEYGWRSKSQAPAQTYTSHQDTAVNPTREEKIINFTVIRIGREGVGWGSLGTVHVYRYTGKRQQAPAQTYTSHQDTAVNHRKKEIIHYKTNGCTYHATYLRDGVSTVHRCEQPGFMRLGCELQ